MPTRLSQWCDRMLEAGWLLAVVIAPLFFNIYTSRVFEPDKLTLVRSLALIMAAAWLIKLVEAWGQRVPLAQALGFSWRTPIVLPALATAGVYLLATALSITPYTSFFGSYQRLQGTYSWLAYLVVFFSMLAGLRTRAQFERLALTMVIVSLPVAIYGLIQRYRLDPLPWGGDVTSRVASHMGNAIFVAAYLIMAFMFTLGRLAETFHSILTTEPPRNSDVVRGALYVFMAAVQLATIYFSFSRGPWLGLMGGLFLFLLLWLVVRRHRTGLLATLGLSAAGLVLLIFLNIPGGPLEFLRQSPYIGRLGHIFETETGTGKVRVLIWQGALQLVLPHAPIQYPDGRSDPFNVLRPLIGYGPESMYVAYNRFYPPALAHYEARTASPDRSHNETFDALVNTGLLGFLVYQWLFFALFAYGLRSLNLIHGPRDRRFLLGLWVGGALGVGWLFALWFGPHFLGVAVPAGTVLGLLAYLIFATLRASGEPSIEHPHRFLLIALLGGILAHYIEINFGIAIASTRTWFWAFAAMLVVLGEKRLSERAPVRSEVVRGSLPARKGKGHARRGGREVVSEVSPPAHSWWPWMAAMGLLMAMMLTLLSYEFIANQGQRLDLLSLIVNSLTRLPLQGNRFSPFILVMFVLTGGLGAALVLAEGVRREWIPGRAWLPALGVYGAVAVGGWLVYTLAHAGLLAALVAQAPRTVEDVLQLARGVAGLLDFLVLFLFVLFVLLVLSISQEESEAAGGAGLGLLVMPPVFLAAALLIWSVHLNPLRADAIYKQGDPWDKQGQWEVAILLYRQAIAYAPREDFYHLWLGRALLEKAARAADSSPRQLPDGISFEVAFRNLTPERLVTLPRGDLLEITRAVLERARELNPLNTDHTANLARMHRRWADLLLDPRYCRTRIDLKAMPPEFVRHVELASRYYGEATLLSPNNAGLWNEWASVDLYQRNDLDAAERKLQRSLQLDDRFDQTYQLYGDLLMVRSEKVEDAAVKRAALEQAEVFYRRLVELQPEHGIGWAALAYLQDQLGRSEEARASRLRLQTLAGSRSEVWQSIGDFFLSHADCALDRGQALVLYREAAQAYGQALLANPGALTAALRRGYALRSMGDLEGAAATFRQALQIAGGSSEIWVFYRELAVTLAMMGRKSEAEEAARQAWRQAPASEQPGLESLFAQLGLSVRP
ncbi:tetratricopeptide repeat protein [Thermoflexus sp.]|uniref:tetratricopeptide repeat protein n=1 Tax=Thermoflexus sp. TaxID=1969742 RepID=UPI0035E440C7